MIEQLESLVITIDNLIDTGRKRHIVGGILLSASLLFGGLALTIVTINDEEKENDYER